MGGTLGGRRIRILLVDDHPLFADALKTLIERSLPAADLSVATSLAEARMHLAGGASFDLALLDLHMPGGRGVDDIADIMAAHPALPVAIVSGLANAADIRAAMALGVRGYLPKSLSAQVMAAALQVLLAGGSYMPADDGTVGMHQQPAAAALTRREREVLVHLAEGKPNKEIARALGLQEITVKLHVRNLFRKLGVRNRVEAANAAQRLWPRTG